MDYFQITFTLNTIFYPSPLLNLTISANNSIMSRLTIAFMTDPIVRKLVYTTTNQIGGSLFSSSNMCPFICSIQLLDATVLTTFLLNLV